MQLCTFAILHLCYSAPLLLCAFAPLPENQETFATLRLCTFARKSRNLCNSAPLRLCEKIKKLTMFLAIQNLIATTAPEILALMPHFNDVFAKFKDYVTTLLTQSIIQNQPITGYKELKTNLQNQMIDLALETATNIIAYANVNGKIEIKSKVNISKSTLTKLTEINCIDTCTNIYRVAKNNLADLADLADYNVTAGSITNLNTAINDFSAIYSIPKDYINIKKMATADIKKVVTLATNQLLISDSLVKMLLNSQPDFTNRYFSLRKIQKPAFKTLALKVNLSNPNKKPIGKALITCDKITFKKPKFTTKLGNFQIKNTPSDVYTFTFSKAGYQILSIEIPITSGERTQLKITLIPNP